MTRAELGNHLEEETNGQTVIIACKIVEKSNLSTPLGLKQLEKRKIDGKSYIFPSVKNVLIFPTVSFYSKKLWIQPVNWSTINLIQLAVYSMEFC